MSIYGIKPTFTDFEGYKKWRAVWRDTYKQVSERVRQAKKALQAVRKQPGMGKPVSDAFKHYAEMRVIAHKLNTVLDEAKLRMSNITTMRRGMETHQKQFPLEVKDCPSLDFHFNKKHLEFSWVPMWVVKTKGQTYYVHHVDSTAPWTTRETPDHTSTKGSIRLRKCDLMIDAEGVAHISPMKVCEPA